jgi:hypothetical protein
MEVCMDQSKVSTDLFLAMNVPDNIRQDSVDLNVGYDELFDEWELIINHCFSPWSSLLFIVRIAESVKTVYSCSKPSVFVKITKAFS